MQSNYRLYIVGWLLVLLVIFGLLPSVAQDMTSSEDPSVDLPVDSSGVMTIPELNGFIDGASTTLIRYPGAVAMTMYAKELTPGHVVTAWWVVWNDASKCSSPGCGPNDLPTSGGDIAAGASMLFADGQVVGEDGTAIYTGFLREGDTSGQAVFDAAGMDDADTAEVHFVLRDHGPVIPEMLEEQLNSFGAGCNNAPPTTGTPGDFECANIQGSGHILGDEWGLKYTVG